MHAVRRPGIVLHGDPVDSASSGSGRKSESGGGRRSKRGKRGAREQEVQVAKVPAHSPGEHPMFKAMAAANGKHDDEDDESGTSIDTGEAEEVAELEPDTIRRAVSGTSDEDLDEDYDDSDDDSDEDSDDDTDDSDDDSDSDDETDELDLDSDDDEDEDDLEDDLDVINGSTEDRDDDEPVTVTAPGRRPRRRAAARPAGPPSTD